MALDLTGYPPYWHIEYGDWFWIHIGYCWMLVMITSIFTISALRNMALFYRRQVLALLLIALLPLTVNIIYVLRMGPLPYLDLTPIAFAVSGAGVLIALRYFHLIDLSPIARNTVFESMIDGVIVLDTRLRVVDANPAIRAMLGKKFPMLCGFQATDLFAAWLPEHAFQQDGEVHTVQIPDSTNTPRWFDLRVNALHHGQQQSRGWLMVLRDITDRHELQERLNALAFYDYLTGLPNRALAHDRLTRDLVRARRRQTRVAVMYLDVDGFKAINDTLGHAAGDHLLQLIAGRLMVGVRESDTVARLGGDEFILIVSDLANPELAKFTAARLLAAFSKPFVLDDKSVTVSVSIGIAVTPDDGLDVEKLIRHADHAMYQAKLRGKNAFIFYADLDDAARGTLSVSL
jgi:diguanylate cyclase (GGDEF)-like protein/PAS domain S-box-containing protein